MPPENPVAPSPSVPAPIVLKAEPLDARSHAPTAGAKPPAPPPPPPRATPKPPTRVGPLELEPEPVALVRVDNLFAPDKQLVRVMLPCAPQTVEQYRALRLFALHVRSSRLAADAPWETSHVELDLEPWACDEEGRVVLLRCTVLVERPDLQLNDALQFEVARHVKGGLPRKRFAPPANAVRLAEICVVEPDQAPVHVLELEPVTSRGIETFAGQHHVRELLVGRLKLAPSSKTSGVSTNDASPIVVRGWQEIGADGSSVIELVLANAAQVVEPNPVASCFDLAVHRVRVGFDADDSAVGRVVAACPRAGLTHDPLERGKPTDSTAVLERGALVDWYDLIPLPDAGEAHLWLAQQARVLRFAFHPQVAYDASRALAQYSGVGFVIGGRWSWYQLREQGPARGRMFTWTDSLRFNGSSGENAMRGMILRDVMSRAAVLSRGDFRDPANGQAFTSMQTMQMGLAQPDLDPSEGGAGGDRIEPVGVRSLSWLELVLAQQEFESTVDRHRQFLLDAVTVEPIMPSRWNEVFGGIPFQYLTYGNTKLPWLRSPAETWLARLVRVGGTPGLGARRCSYEAKLREFQPIDHQHQVRIAKPTGVLTELAGSCSARFVFEVLATNNLLHYHNKPGEITTWGESWKELARDVDVLGEHVGHPRFGRGLAWAMIDVAWFFRFAPTLWRTEALNDCVLPFLALDARATMSTRRSRPGMLPLGLDRLLHEPANGLVLALGEGSRHRADASTRGMPDKKSRVTQTFEEALHVFARLACVRVALPWKPNAVEQQGGASRSIAIAALERNVAAAASLLDTALIRGGGVPWFLGTADVDGKPFLQLTEFSQRSQDVERDHPFHLVWSAAMSHAILDVQSLREKLSPDDVVGELEFPPREMFLVRALQLRGGFGTFQLLVQQTQALESTWGAGVAQYAGYLWAEVQSVLSRL